MSISKATLSIRIFSMFSTNIKWVKAAKYFLLFTIIMKISLLSGICLKSSLNIILFGAPKRNKWDHLIFNLIRYDLSQIFF